MSLRLSPPTRGDGCMGTYWTPCAYIHRLCTRPMSMQKSYFSVAVSARWGRRLREQYGFLHHGREEKAVTKGLGTYTWTPIVPALCLSG